MKRLETVLLLSLMGWLGRSASAAEGTNLRFDIYSGYFVSNKFEPHAAESFAVIDNQKDFDRVFSVETAKGEKPHYLPKDAFKSSVVVAVIKRGKASWEFRVDGVTEANGIVELHYTTTSKKNNSASVACALIVSISKGRFGAVHFMEDKRLVKVIEIGKK